MGRKIDKSPTRVNIRDLRLCSPDEHGMTVEFSLSQDDNYLALDMLHAVLTHYGINRHSDIVAEWISTPGALDRIAAEAAAKKILEG